MVATRLDTVPRALWIWDRNSNAPVALLLFQHEVKKVLWHPVQKDVLAVVTDDQLSCVYVYHSLRTPPRKVNLLGRDSVITGKWTAQWCKVTNSARCPILVSSNKCFFIGMLRLSEGEVIFESVLSDHTDQSLDEESSLFDTPSKVPANSHHPMALNAPNETLWRSEDPSSGKW